MPAPGRLPRKRIQKGKSIQPGNVCELTGSSNKNRAKRIRRKYLLGKITLKKIK